jgi:5'-3' exonuclease
MGIPSYFSHIVKSHRRIIKQVNKFVKVNNLYLDCNSIVYDVVNKLDFSKMDTNEADELDNYILNEVCNSISNYISSIKPNEKVFIAFDGVAPVAKLEQQRNRRYKSWFQNEVMKQIKNSHPRWDTTCITPGTIFMTKLNQFVKHFFIHNKKFGVKEIIVSGSDQPGEGEHKIYKYIRDNSEYHKEVITVIYGLDADLIMLTLNHLHISKNLYLFRETPHFIKTIDKTLNPNELYVIDIPKMEEEILNNFVFNCDNISSVNVSSNMIESSQLTETQKNNKIFDYIFICFMLGNDFLPHFPSINIRTNGIDILMNAYKHVFNNKNDFLTDGKTIVWKNFRKFLYYLANNELNYFNQEMKIREKWEKKYINGNSENNTSQLEESFMFLPTKNREIEKYINPGDDGWESRYYKMLFNVDIDDERKSQICMNYLEGIEWTLKYYTTGCPDWRWSYNYHYAPLLKDLVSYTPYFNVEFISNNDKCKMTPVSEYTQLCYVLPRNSLHYLPSRIYSKLMEKYEYLYGTDYEFSWSFCKYFWEAHVNLPHIDIKNIEELVESN